MQLLVARAAGAERELVHAVAAERGMRVAVDEARDRAQPAAVELDDVAVERRQVAHPPDGLDRVAVAEDERVLEHLDVAERRSAQRGARPAGVASCARSRRSRAGSVTRRGDARDLQPACLCGIERLGITRVDVPQHAHARVGREHPLEPLRLRVGAVGEDDHARMDRVADPDAAAVMDAHPRRSRRHVDERVEDRPVGDRVGAVAHRLGLAIRRGDRAGVEVIPPDHDRRHDLAARTSSLIASPAFARSP